MMAWFYFRFNVSAQGGPASGGQVSGVFFLSRMLTERRIKGLSHADSHL
jgi:hypothetical protein